jgi:hypothetical protein
VRLYCFLAAVVGILGGLALMAGGLDMLWHGVLMLAVGGFALWFGLRMSDEDTPTVRTDPPAGGSMVRGDDGPYTPEHFPFPPSTPGTRFAEVGPDGSADRPDDAVEALAVVCPRSDAGPDGLRAIGAALRDWCQSTPDVVRIEGMAPMLEGRYPQTPTVYYLSPRTADLIQDHPELTERLRSTLEDTMSVAVVIVAGRACNEETGASLLRAMNGLPVAMVVDPLFYDAITR